LRSTGSKYYKLLTDANFTYKQSDCMDLCFSEYLFDECKCYEGSTINFFNDQICKTKEDIKCMESFFSKFDHLYIQICDCPLECYTISYKLSTSFSTFPTSGYSELYNRSYNMPVYDLKEVLLSLNIFFDDFRFTMIDEKSKTDWTDLLSNIGG
jgi:hypothetical protein